VLNVFFGEEAEDPETCNSYKRSDQNGISFSSFSYWYFQCVANKMKNSVVCLRPSLLSLV
jgi:hypothetical protein